MLRLELRLMGKPLVPLSGRTLQPKDLTRVLHRPVELATDVMNDQLLLGQPVEPEWFRVGRHETQCDLLVPYRHHGVHACRPAPRPRADGGTHQTEYFSTASSSSSTPSPGVCGTIA